MNIEGKSVVIVDGHQGRNSLLNRALKDLGATVKARLESTDQLLAYAGRIDLLFVGVDMPQEGMLNDIREFNHLSPLPIIMFAEQDTPDVIEKVVSAGVGAFVVSDIQVSRLPSIVNIAQLRFDEKYALKAELAEVKSKLEERKLVDKAKGLIMQHKNVNESTAYSMLRKMAMNKGVTMASTAKGVIEVMSFMDNDIAS